jgi:hypothetical protein
LSRRFIKDISSSFPGFLLRQDFDETGRSSNQVIAFFIGSGIQAVHFPDSSLPDKPKERP